MYKTLIRITIVGVVCLSRLSCSTSPVAGGTSTTGNSVIAGSIVDADNTPANRIPVACVPEEYNPVISPPLPDSCIDTTDESGSYSFTSIRSGTYHILARNPADGMRLQHTFITVTGDTVDGLVDTLKPVGAIKVVLPDTVNITRGFVYVQGTDIFNHIDAPIVYLDSVPAGKTPPLLYTNLLTDEVITPSVTVASGDTVLAAAVLYIVGPDTGSFGVCDSIVSHQLQTMGLNVVVKDENAFLLNDTSGIDIIVISTSITLETNLAVLKNVAKPVLVMEYYFLYEMGMTDSVKNIDFGGSPRMRNLALTDSTHPIVSGLANPVAFYIADSTAGFNWGKPAGNATVVACVPNTSDSAFVFCYNKGDLMLDISAPARRATFLMWTGDIQYISEEGWRLLHNIIHWIVE